MEAIIQTSKTTNFPPSPPPLKLHDEYEGFDFAELQSEEDHPLWKTERVELKSVGIDIGSSTSHLMFSRLVLRRFGIHLSSKFVVVERKVVWKSPILLTPYVNHNLIDTRKLSHFVENSYRQAGFTPEEIDTGAVIITGEALRKKNAEAILGLFAAQAGKFVCATAGPNLEAMLAAYGCGGVKKSFSDGIEKKVMVVDVGGGTTKVAIARRGLVRETAAFNVGARLLVTDQEGRLTRVEKAAKVIGEELGINISLGNHITEASKQDIASLLADILFNVLERRPLSPLAEKLMITPPLNFSEPIDLVIFTGGVAEYIYDCEKGDFGDLGEHFGKEIRKHCRSSAFGIPVDDAEEKIRATVIGASQYTIQISGNTIFITDEALLPMKNIQVISPELPSEDALNREEISRAIEKTLRHFDIVEGEQQVALALHWDLGPAYPRLRALAEGIREAFKNSIKAGLPLILVFDTDFGALVGNILRRELGVDNEIISIDLVHLHNFDFIDIGEILKDVEAVPLVVKSLVFMTEKEKVFLQKDTEDQPHPHHDHHEHNHTH
jgi:ethanolamine utilization protein EutA